MGGQIHETRAAGNSTVVKWSPGQVNRTVLSGGWNDCVADVSSNCLQLKLHATHVGG